MSRPLPVFTVDELERSGRTELPPFTNEDAFALGTIAANLIIERGSQARRRPPAISPDASLLVNLRQEASGIAFTDLDLDHSMLMAFGGSIPLYVGGALTATITMSGEPDVIDHATCAEAVARYVSRAGNAL